ncbi:MAG TPA: DUF6249 domain-containing protein [Chthoniobacterales bacterium]|nr:DUF6249 domain-containing protein [Chthoniobacterales bacterium]
MKTTLLTCLCSLALALTGLGQSPTASAAPGASVNLPVPVPPPVPPVVAPAVPLPPPVTSATGTPKDDNDLESRIEKKVKKGLHITFGDDEDSPDARKRDHRRHAHDSDVEDSALMAIPIIGIIFSTLFGAPVLIVGVIMFFSYWKSRSLHRTVRLMVEKGQPVPEALFSAAPTVIRQRSDMRRGVVLVMVGLGIMIFFGAVNEWEGGAWAMGIIPFLIGCGYLLVWKLEGDKRSTDNTPRLP